MIENFWKIDRNLKNTITFNKKFITIFKILLMFNKRVNKNEKNFTKRAHERGKFYKKNKMKLEMIFWRRNFILVILFV